MIEDDILLLKRICSKDEYAFKYVFDTYFVSLCRYVDIYLDSKQEGEELILDLFMHLWERSNEINLNLSLKAYLFRAARNRSLNFLRDRKTSVSLDEIGDVADENKDSLFEVQELDLLIQDAICALPDRCREVFQLSRDKDMTNKEIANEMKISIKTVEAQITKALKFLKKNLSRQHPFLF